MKFRDNVIVEITTEEAEKGCTRYIALGGLKSPIKLSIPPKIKDEAVIEITNAEYVDGDETVNQTLSVIVYVVDPEAVRNETKQTSKKRILMWLLPLILVLLVTVAVIIIVV